MIKLSWRLSLVINETFPNFPLIRIAILSRMSCNLAPAMPDLTERRGFFI